MFEEINWFVTLSNVFGLIPVYSGICLLRRCPREDIVFNVVNLSLITTSIISSMLMHMAETKHNLPGLCCQSFSHTFLWLDRVTAVVMGCYTVAIAIENKKILHEPLVKKALFAVTINLLSENFAVNPLIFALTHATWHYLAYDLIQDVFYNEFDV
jgi:hypothetical protein